MSEINTSIINGNNWAGSTTVNANNQDNIDAQLILYKKQRESEKQLIYEQLTSISHQNTPQKRSSKMVALIAKHKYVA